MYCTLLRFSVAVISWTLTVSKRNFLFLLITVFLAWILKALCVRCQLMESGGDVEVEVCMCVWYRSFKDDLS
jgi:uncharacterized membrane protein